MRDVLARLRKAEQENLLLRALLRAPTNTDLQQQLRTIEAIGALSNVVEGSIWPWFPSDSGVFWIEPHVEHDLHMTQSHTDYAVLTHIEQAGLRLTVRVQNVEIACSRDEVRCWVLIPPGGQLTLLAYNYTDEKIALQCGVIRGFRFSAT